MFNTKKKVLDIIQRELDNNWKHYLSLVDQTDNSKDVEDRKYYLKLRGKYMERHEVLAELLYKIKQEL